MASNSGGVILIALGLVAIGLAADHGDGSDAEKNAAADTDVDFAEDTCDGVVVVQSASGTAEFPGEQTLTDSSVECDMDEGDGDDDAVRTLQEALVTCNGQEIPVDGIYGDQTRQAVSNVQQQSGVSVDGTFDPETRDAMQWPTTSATGTTTCVTGIESSTASDEGS